MKKLSIILLLAVLIMSCAATKKSPQQTSQQAILEPAVELTFAFTRQNGPASNQFAVWVEDAEGLFVKTLFASRWTANGGWSRRPSSIPIWVQRSGLAEMSAEQIDTVSGATPQSGILTYVWDGTDSNGAIAPAGNYVLYIEGTLRWENQILCSAPIDLGNGAAVPLVNIEYTGDSTQERSMITEVAVQVLR